MMKTILLLLLSTLMLWQGTATGARPLYYDREITRADLEGRTLRELSLLRNTIFARAGNPFRKQWLHDYFSAQPWYRPAARMDESKLSDLDRKNAAFIADYEAKLPRAELIRRREHLAAKNPAALGAEDKIELMLLARQLGEASEIVAASDPLTEPKLLDKLITLEQLSDYSRRDLKLLRNTIYARRGRPFKSGSLKDYFGRMAWYKADAGYTDARLNEIDRKNIKIILSLEDELGGPLSESESRREDWFGSA